MTAIDAYTEPPFPPDRALNNEPIIPTSATMGNSMAHYLTIPGNPNIDLSPNAVIQFLSAELVTPILDELYPHLWKFARKSGIHIDPLHGQVVKGRKITITEDPKLHLVWFSDVVFVKPLPLYLLNYNFWKVYLCVPPSTGDQSQNGPKPDASFPVQHRKAALGFLRTYAILIQHHSDFCLAVKGGVLPAEMEWRAFARFISLFRHLDDKSVSLRYHYGQLRLTRLNYAVRLHQPRTSPSRWYYHVTHWHTSAYVERFFAPLLFIFGSVAIVLSAMQVVLTVPDGKILVTEQWDTVARASWGFCIALIISILLLWFALAGGILVFIGFQLRYAVKVDRHRRYDGMEDPPSRRAVASKA